jgi:subtilisin family serine protease
MPKPSMLPCALAGICALLMPVGALPAANPLFATHLEARAAAETTVTLAQFNPKRKALPLGVAKKPGTTPKGGRGSGAKFGRNDDPPDRRRPHGRKDPRVPLIIAIPDTAEGRARYLESLPRREQQPPPQGRAVQQTVARQILVLIDQTQPQSLGLELARTHGMERLSSRLIELLGARAELFRVRGSRSDAAVLAALQRDGRIRSAQFNQRYFHSGGEPKAAAIPQYGPRNVRLPDAHKLALGRNVMVAVIDSGIDMTHPDLKGAIVSSFDAAGGRDTGPDFHGTAVAGIIRARGIVEGVAPQAKIMAVRAFRVSAPGALPQTDTDVLLTAIDWAVKNGARVLNLSFVGSRDTALEALLEAARQKRIVMVAAAGNGGPAAAPAFPAAYPGVIAVTAVDEADRRYRHANRGSYIAVAAPGVDILAPVERGRHSYLSGTSFAAAYVSGIAALLLERDPNLDGGTLAALIAAGADDLGPIGRDDDFGAGRVNAFGSLQAMAPGLATKQ